MIRRTCLGMNHLVVGRKSKEKKKVPKATNKEGNESSKEKRKKRSGKYLSNDDVKSLEENLKSYVLRAQTQCEMKK